jgi:hypothetical protein
VLRDRAAAADILKVAGSKKVGPFDVSTQGQGGQPFWTFGRVAYRAARHKPCPTVLVRSAAGAAGTA